MKLHIKNHIEKSLHLPEGKIIDLSGEVLSIADYTWLAEIITKSSMVETILLPIISKEEAKIIVSLLNKATIRTSSLMQMDIIIDNEGGECPESILRMCQQIQFRLQRNRKKIFAIHGGGNIGLGLMADVVSQSPFDYNVIATSNNALISHLVNIRNTLWLQHNPCNPHDSTCVSNVTMISRDGQDVVRLYHEAAIVAICVTAAVIPNITKDIAQALISRFKNDGSGIKILVLMNMPDCATFVRDKVFNEIISIIGNENEAEEIISVVEFVPTVIDRIVTPISEEKIKLQLKGQLEKINKEILLINLGSDNIEHILASTDTLIKAVTVFNLQFNLFNAERHFSIHVHESHVEARRFPLIKRVDDLNIIEAIKNKYMNGPHAILAWLGALLGCETIADSINNPIIFTFIKEMMEHEISPILLTEYPELSNKDLEKLEDTFLDRCKASLDDPVVRVGRDPMRKLDVGGRVRGTIELAKKHNLTISTTKLEQGLAAGFLYAVNFDPSNPGCQKIKEIYEKNNRSFRAVLCYSGEAPSGKFTGLTPHRDEKLINNVLGHISYFNHLHKQSVIKSSPSSTAFVLSKMNNNHQLISVPKILFTSKPLSIRPIRQNVDEKKQSAKMFVPGSKTALFGMPCNNKKLAPSVKSKYPLANNHMRITNS